MRERDAESYFNIKSGEHPNKANHICASFYFCAPSEHSRLRLFQLFAMIWIASQNGVSTVNLLHEHHEGQFMLKGHG